MNLDSTNNIECLDILWWKYWENRYRYLKTDFSKKIDVSGNTGLFFGSEIQEMLWDIIRFVATVSSWASFVVESLARWVWLLAVDQMLKFLSCGEFWHLFVICIQSLLHFVKVRQGGNEGDYLEDDENFHFLSVVGWFGYWLFDGLLVQVDEDLVFRSRLYTLQQT